MQRDKVREAERRKDQLEKLAVKRKEHTEKLMKELEELKHQFSEVQKKTGYDPSKDTHKVVPTPYQVSHPQKNTSDQDNVRIKKVPISQHAEVEDDLEVCVKCILDS